MNEESTITFVNTLLSEGNSRLVILEQLQGTQPVQPDNGFAVVSSDALFTGKTIFEVPVCLKETRYVQLDSTTQNIIDELFTYVSFRSPQTIPITITWILPSADGTINQVLATDGSGTLSWINAGAGPGTVETAIPFTTDNALTRVDLTPGNEFIQQSAVLLSDTDRITGLVSVDLDENVTFRIDPLNTIYGFDAGDSITSGLRSTLIGNLSGNAITTADDVTAVGDNSGTLANLTGNTYVGSSAGSGCTAGTQMTIIGFNACQSITGGIGSITAIGNTSLQLATNAPSTVAIGNQVMSSLLTGSGNTIVGALGMRNATATNENSGLGFDVLHDNLTSPSNTAMGWEAGFGITGGTGFNVLLGKSCCQNLLTGGSNIVLGNNAAANYVGAESNNIILAAAGVAAESGVIRLGINATHTSTFIQGIHSVTPSGAAQMVVIDATLRQATFFTSGALRRAKAYGPCPFR